MLLNSPETSYFNSLTLKILSKRQVEIKWIDSGLLSKLPTGLGVELCRAELGSPEVGLLLQVYQGQEM